MNRLMAFLLVAFALVRAGDLKFRVVLDTADPGAYNRWVWLHRSECPDLPTVYITVDSTKHRGYYEWPAVSFWTDSGPLLMHRILPDSQVVSEQAAAICDISHNLDQLTVCSGNLTFGMYDRFGTRLFTDPSRPQGLTLGRWTRFTFHPPGTALLDDSGKVLSRISTTEADVLYSSDSLCALSADGSVIFIGRDGRELWRSRKINAHCAVAAAPNGGPVAAATSDSVIICSPPGTKTVVLPHDREWALFNRPTMAWSADGKLLAVYQGSKTAWDSGRVFVVNTEGRRVRPIRRVRLYSVRSLLWMGDTLVFPALNIDVSHRDPRFDYSVSADSYVISFMPPRGNVRRGTIPGKFRLYGRWTGSGRHLAYMLPPRRFVLAELVR